MTKEQYLKDLKNNIQSLSLDEQNEAIQYYSDYFEEAGDDEKVMAELGSPEDLAQTIIEKFANALVNAKSTVKDSESNSNEEQNSESKSNSPYDALYFEFEKSKVINLVMNLGAAEVVLIPGKKYTIETRGISRDAMNCYLSSDGTLTINNSKRININFWSHERRSRIIPRILVSIPENAELNRFKLVVGAGDLRSKDISLTASQGTVDVGAGNLVLKSLHGGSLNLRCGMGNLEFTGKITGQSNIDCGMGSVRMILLGDAEKYSYDAKVGLGDVKFNDEKKSGVCQVLNNPKKENHFSVNCGMGSVSIKFVK